jgi:hypothetical protein
MVEDEEPECLTAMNEFEVPATDAEYSFTGPTKRPVLSSITGPQNNRLAIEHGIADRTLRIKREAEASLMSLSVRNL